jgi:hypothetical protein
MAEGTDGYEFEQFFTIVVLVLLVNGERSGSRKICSHDMGAAGSDPTNSHRHRNSEGSTFAQL